MQYGDYMCNRDEIAELTIRRHDAEEGRTDRSEAQGMRFVTTCTMSCLHQELPCIDRLLPLATHHFVDEATFADEKLWHDLTKGQNKQASVRTGTILPLRLKPLCVMLRLHHYWKQPKGKNATSNQIVIVAAPCDGTRLKDKCVMS